MVKQKMVAIIPARGGSKRIPYKNIMEFMGKPLIAWTIEAAQQSGLFSRIFVSTDDPKIADVAQQCGVEVPFLREENADDISTVSQATVSAVNQLKSKLNESYDVVVQLMPNCPMRTSDDIQQSYENFKTAKAVFQISCFKFGWMNPWWAVKLASNQQPQPIFPEALKTRSQDLPPLYCPTGAIWIAKTEALLKSQTFYGDGHIFYPVDWTSAVDIDEPEDVEFAKAIFQMKFKNKEVHA